MKTTIRNLVAVGAVLILVAGVWGSALAERGSSSSQSAGGLGRLFEAFHRSGAESVQAASVSAQPGDDNPSAKPEDNAMPQAGEDNPARLMDDNSSGTPEPGDDMSNGNAGAQMPEAHAELSGVVTAISGTSITINGQVFQFAANAEGVTGIQVGDNVKLEFATAADGSIVVREVKAGDPVDDATVTHEAGDDSSISHESGGGSGSDDGHHGGGSGGSGGGGDGGSGG